MSLTADPFCQKVIFDYKAKSGRLQHVKSKCPIASAWFFDNVPFDLPAERVPIYQGDEEVVGITTVYGKAGFNLA